MSEKVAIETPITVGEFAKSIDVKTTDVISELMNNGVMATINDTIDFETAAIVAEDLGVDVTQADHAEGMSERKKQGTVLEEGEGETRPPIVAVMGHVDHGKTTLLDALRESNTAAGEAGGITQHISAYQIKHNDRWVTFLDTPGHEAFSILREHGAYLTDVAIVTIAADDGIKPQTEETLRYVQEAGVRMVIAINKIDKPDADVNRVKQQLADKNLVPEEWGGDTVVVEISAHKRQNLDKLLDMVLLVADIEDLRSRYEGPAEGVVIESRMVQGKGSVPTILVQHGELNVGDFLVAGDVYAKVRSLEDFTGGHLKTAYPGMPVAVTGWKGAPKLAAFVQEYTDEKSARNATENAQDDTASRSGITQADALTAAMQAHKADTIPVIVKADVDGSLAAVTQSLEALKNEEVKVEIVSSGVGTVSESDVTLAESTKAIIIGFGVTVQGRIKRLAMQAGVEIRVYNVIYELIDDMRDQLNSLLKPEVIEEVQAELEVKGVFKLAQKEILCGGQLKTGKLVTDLNVRVKDGEEIGVVKSIQREQQSAKEINQGEMCGLSITTKRKHKIKEGDILEFFTREEKQRTI